MRILYHMWLSPESRKVRIALAEKGLEFEMKTENVWEWREQFLKMNPAGDVPVMVEPDGTILADSIAITEFLEESWPQPTLMPETAIERAEARRIVRWFDDKFTREVSRVLISEKVLKRFLKMGEPDSDAIRCALQNIKTHMRYVSFLVERRNYLAGARFTLADVAAAAQLSVVDYLGDVAWSDYPAAKDWYMRVKSRKSFRGLLADRIPGLTPPKYYEKLDF